MSTVSSLGKIIMAQSNEEQKLKSSWRTFPLLSAQPGRVSGDIPLLARSGAMLNVSLAIKAFNPFQVLEKSLGCQILLENFCCETQKDGKPSNSISQPSPHPRHLDFHPPAAQA